MKRDRRCEDTTAFALPVIVVAKMIVMCDFSPVHTSQKMWPLSLTIMQPSDPYAQLIFLVRDGDTTAWQTLIDKFEGRLLAFAFSRIHDRTASEDIVQETFIGFLTSLPNYDPKRSLESYLFSICAYKLTDHLRRSGRRPAIAIGRKDDSSGFMDSLKGAYRGASSIARSGERKRLEESAVVQATAELIQRWRSQGEWVKLKCIELLIVCGLGNKEVGLQTGLSEQQVANYKSDFHQRLRSIIQRSGLDADVFPELHA